jgi:exopolyphosphatase / guanosine-5'-triphosphate,3'-diphosphate pyrophosphatase
VPRVAIVDVGSNTAKLVDYAYEVGRSFRQVDELRSAVRLSEGMAADGLLQREPFERGVSALRTFASYCRAAAVDDVVVTATSAVRAAANGGDFVQAVRRDTGIGVRVLSGEEEARCGALAVANAFALSDAVVVDLGGGSVQLSRLVQRRYAAGASWPLGAVRATELYLRGDPPRVKSVRSLAEATRNAVEPWLARHGGPGPLPLVGIGGTIRNLANIDQARRGYPLNLLHGYRLERAAVDALADELVGLDAARRGELPGLNRDRADIIAAGAVVVAAVMAAAGADAVTVSGQGLREGLLYPFLVPTDDHLLEDVRAFSVLNLMRQYHDHAAHNEHVRYLALALFDALVPIHGLGAEHRELLGAAALVHDIGMAVDYYRHEHHGFTLMVGRALPGFSHREQAIIALLVRHHRKGPVGDGGLAGLLADGDASAVRVLSGLLRVAEYLDRGKAQRVAALRVTCRDSVVHIGVHAHGESRLEVEATRARSDLLAAALGRRIEIAREVEA